MSLMYRIGRGLVAKPKPAGRTIAQIVAAHPELAKPPAERAKPPPLPRAKSAETRQRMSDSQRRRYAKSDPVPTSAQAGEEQRDAAADEFRRATDLSTSVGIAKQLTRMITPPKSAPVAPAAPRITPPPLPPVPPRAELDLVKSLEALPLPVPAAAPPAPVLTGRGSCKARNPATGIQCALLAGHTKLHRHGSTEFRFGAAPGTSAFPRRDALEEAAHGRPDSPFTTT